MVGKRSLSWYEKLLNIPRVHLVKPDVEARRLITDASMICVITGSIALEGAILGKPVITLGDGPFNALPNHMVRQCKNLRELPGLITHQLNNHHHDESGRQAAQRRREGVEAVTAQIKLLQAGQRAQHAGRESAQ